MPKQLLTSFTLLFLFWTHIRALNPFLSANKFPSVLLPISDSFASNTGEIQLAKDALGFYVNVDLAHSPSEDLEQHFGPNTVSMILSLYTSQTLLVDNCLHFSPYNCSKYSCTGYANDSVPVHSPYFTGEGYLAKANIYLDYEYWTLNTNASIAASCSANTVLPYGLTRSGVLGLGIANNSKLNFINSPVFSLSLAKDLLSGQLLFGQNPNINSSRDLVAVFQADDDWHVNASSFEIVVGNKSTSLSTNLIFDVNAEAIGLPIELYNQILDFFATEASMNCTTHAYQPVCLYHGEISTLPNITISAQNQIIVIHPDTYVLNTKFNANSSIITLNMKAISPNLSDFSYITSKYTNYIILDSHVMRKYTIQFDATSTPTIRLYGDSIGYQGNAFWITVIVVTVVFLAVVFCCCFCTWKQAPPPKIKDIRTEGSFTIKSPLLRENTQLDGIEESPPTKLIRPKKIVSDSQFMIEDRVDDFHMVEPKLEVTKPSDLNL